MSATFILSDKLFSGFKVTVPLIDIWAVHNVSDDTCRLVASYAGLLLKTSLISFLQSRDLYALVDEAKKLPVDFHVHDNSCLRGGEVYLCTGCHTIEHNKKA